MGSHAYGLAANLVCDAKGKEIQPLHLRHYIHALPCTKRHVTPDACLPVGVVDGNLACHHALLYVCS